MRMVDASQGERRPFPFAQPGWRGTSDGRCLWVSADWTQLTGQSAADALDHGWLTRIHPDDRRALVRCWWEAREPGHGLIDVRLIDAAEQPRWFRVELVREAGSAGWSGNAVDVDDLYRRLNTERMRRVALQHRVRNTLAVIRSVARRTGENSETVEDYRVHFDGRLSAFARAQGHILRAGEGGVDLESLLADELLANQAGHGDRVAYAGPEVRLTPRLTDLLALAFHELIANAVQFGGLSGEDGRLDVRWWTEGSTPDRLLQIEWHEEIPANAPALSPPDHEGFGLELLTRSLSYEVDAVVDLAFRDCGIRYTLRIPFPETGRRS